MSYEVIVQNSIKNKEIPKPSQMQKWTEAALRNFIDDAEICLKVVDEAESIHLNYTYRKKNKPTNVLSFPFEAPPGVVLEKLYLGDLALCHSVIENEAIEQNKEINAHWAHMIVHGVLHLLGYDHLNDADAQKMESIEINILKQLGYPNPYGDEKL